MFSNFPGRAVFAFYAVLTGASYAAVNLPEPIDIPYKRVVLKNGLTLIVHEDHKAPVVAVNVWYHVGSKNEKPGRTGFAHLFEHLMFNGSENFNDDFFKGLQMVGATDYNGTTSEDRTNYFEEAPANALDFLLWLESDRMGHFAKAISQERLDEQRGVVQNEKRQGENQPYGRADELITHAVYPSHHPYSWTVIGSMEDLNAASLDDVKQWFATYYGPANATLVIAGDVKAEEAVKLVEKNFGDIPSGPPISKFEEWIAKRSGTQRQVMQDRVPLARLYKVWNVPPYGAEDNTYLELLAAALSNGKSSRLYKRLIYDQQVATSVFARVDSSEIGSVFNITATARPGEDLHKMEAMINEELARLIKDGPTHEELERVKMERLSGFIRQAERLGGFGGKADILAGNEVYLGNAAFYKTELERVRKAGSDDIRAAGKKWLTDGDYNLEVHPFPEFTTAKSEVDRSKLPTLSETPDAKFPELQRAELENGLKVIVAERHAIPTVMVNLLVDAGYATDTPETLGRAQLATRMMQEGTKTLNSLELNDRMRLLGANLSAGSDLDTSGVYLSALKANLDESLDLFADMALHPVFPEKEFPRLKKNQLDRIKQEKVQPNSMGYRVLPQLLYGEGHAYAKPLTGSGTEAAVEKLTTVDTKKFYEEWFKPNAATLVVVGDTTLKEILPKLQKRFAGWQRGETPKKAIAEVKPAGKNVVYLMDRPGSIQSLIFAGELAVPKNNPNEPAITTANDVLGGDFLSRINMNLREDKHWSYGSGSFLRNARGQRPFLVSAPVQSDKTKEAIIEVRKELTGILGDKPITEDEFEKDKKKQTLELAGTWQTMGAVSGSIAEMVEYGLPEDYFQTYSARVKALTREQAQEALKQVVHPDRLTWVIIGDLAKVEAGIREIGLGEIRRIDADGRIVSGAEAEVK
jgi:zinc protease